MKEKLPVEFVDWKSFPREEVGGQVKGIWQMMISRDPEGRCLARILEYDPGTDTTPNGVQSHDYYEEVILLEGSFTDLTLGKTFKAGEVASRPPHMPHSPWVSQEGCVMYEVEFFLNETAKT